MRLNHVKVLDIEFEYDFFADYDHAPGQVRKKVDQLVRSILDLGRFTPGFNAHTAHGQDTNIGYVTRSGTHWRILFDYDEYQCKAVFKRLLAHEDMDRIFVP